jgi:hypothetical protein
MQKHPDMKTKIIPFVLSLCFFTGLSQDDESKKPTQKSISVEVNAAPFSANPISLTYLRLRGFVADRHAVRFGILVSGRTDNPTKDSEGSTFSYLIRPGYEYHFKGNKHLSPFVGV